MIHLSDSLYHNSTMLASWSLWIMTGLFPGAHTLCSIAACFSCRISQEGVSAKNSWLPIGAISAREAFLSLNLPTNSGYFWGSISIQQHVLDY